MYQFIYQVFRKIEPTSRSSSIGDSWLEKERIAVFAKDCRSAENKIKKLVGENIKFELHFVKEI